MPAYAASLCSVVTAYVIIFGSASTADPQGLHFLRDKNFDNLKVTSDSDRLVLFTSSLIGCGSACLHHAWCSSFFYTKTNRECCLHATVFVEPYMADADESPGTAYYRNDVPWCLLEDWLLYNRPAGMCVYLEGEDPGSWSTADEACTDKNMTLASNLTPLKMDALLNITKKNPEMMDGIYVGLQRSDKLRWLDQEPLDEVSFLSYWDEGQPSAGTNENCVIIEASNSKLDDFSCDALYHFVCEMLQFPPEP